MHAPIFRRNTRQRAPGFKLLCSLPASNAQLVFLDPQYRSVLDKLAFGNEGRRQAARAKLPQQTDYSIALLVEQTGRVLVPSGHLMFWTDKYAIGTGRHLRYFVNAPALHVVDLICWHTLRFGMGRRTRSTCEYLVIAQKEPVRAKGRWRDRAIRDCWSEMADRTLHTHAKPYELAKRLIRSVTDIGDLVVDPCAGGYGILEACRETRREFIGCDIAG
jgi:site-specific DNA-methyltransferase (adenine-specific)